MKTYICTAVFNPEEKLTRWLDCLEGQTNSDFSIIIIDDGSTENLTIQSTLKNKIDIVKGSGNLWWGGGMISAVEEVRKHLKLDGDALISICNVDTILPFNYVETIKIVHCVANNIITSPLCVDETGKRIAGFWFDPSNLKIEERLENELINCFPTRALAFRLSNYDQIGGVDPVLRHYFSDVDLTYRFGSEGKYNLLALTQCPVFFSKKESNMMLLNKWEFAENFRKTFNLRYKNHLPSALHVLKKYNSTLPYFFRGFILLGKRTACIILGSRL